MWGWTLSTDFVYGTDCFPEVVCSGESPSSSGLLAVERVRFTGSPERGQERLQRNRSPGGLQESVWGFRKKQNRGPLSCYFENWMCNSVVEFSSLLTLGADIFTSLCTTHGSSPLFTSTCVSGIWEPFPHNSFCQKHHIPNRQAP